MKLPFDSAQQLQNSVLIASVVAAMTGLAAVIATMHCAESELGRIGLGAFFAFLVSLVSQVAHRKLNGP